MSSITLTCQFNKNLNNSSSTISLHSLWSIFSFKVLYLFTCFLFCICKIKTLLYIWLSWLGVWCLTPLSTVFQLYWSGQFYWWRKQEHQKKTTDLSQVTDKLDHIMLYWVHLAMNGVQTPNFSGPCYQFEIQS